VTRADVIVGTRRLALDMLDQMNNEWALPKRPVGAEAGYGDATEFRLGLEERGYNYVVAVKDTTSAHPEPAQPTLVASSGRGRPPKPRYRHDPTNLREIRSARPQLDEDVRARRGLAHCAASARG
jgi:SRSO17 transposase